MLSTSSCYLLGTDHSSLITVKEGAMDKYRVGIVGCGGIAHRHAEGYRAVAGDLCQIVAGCDVNRGTLDDFCDREDLIFVHSEILRRIDQVERVGLEHAPKSKVRRVARQARRRASAR